MTEDGGGRDEGVGGQDGARVPLLRTSVVPEAAYVGHRFLPLAADPVDDEAVTNDCGGIFLVCCKSQFQSSKYMYISPVKSKLANPIGMVK